MYLWYNDRLYRGGQRCKVLQSISWFPSDKKIYTTSHGIFSSKATHISRKDGNCSQSSRMVDTTQHNTAEREREREKFYETNANAEVGTHHPTHPLSTIPAPRDDELTKKKKNQIKQKQKPFLSRCPQAPHTVLGHLYKIMSYLERSHPIPPFFSNPKKKIDLILTSTPRHESLHFFFSSSSCHPFVTTSLTFCDSFLCINDFPFASSIDGWDGRVRPARSCHKGTNSDRGKSLPPYFL